MAELVDSFTQARGRMRTLIRLDPDSVPLHEFSWHDGTGGLASVPLSRSPSLDADPRELAKWLTDHTDAVLDGSYALPPKFRADFADALVPPPELAVAEDLRLAFQRETCNGCHSERHAAKDRFFHVSPSRSDSDKLSLFLTSDDGELARRQVVLGDRLCE
jgi:hypothetical protein